MEPEELTCGSLSEGKSQISPNAAGFFFFFNITDCKTLENRDSSFFHSSSLAANFLL